MYSPNFFVKIARQFVMYDVIYFPIWIEYSGLPELLNKQNRTVGAWSVFKKLIELDCSTNPDHGTIELSINELSVCTGIQPKIIAKILKVLQKKEYIAAFIPDNFEEKGLFRIHVPVKTPLSYNEVLKKHKVTLTKIQQIPSERYANESELDSKQKRELQKVIDLYFSTISQKMNNFILDQLKLINLTFPMHLIKKVFDIGRRNEIKSLHWAIQQLYREAKKDDKR